MSAATSRAQQAIRLRSGRRFKLFSPDRSDFTFEDMMYPLAAINRYCGHAGHYNVLDHSVLVADLVVQHLGRPALAAEALFHDFPEAFYGDVISPLRRGLPDYQQAYSEGERVIFEALGLPRRLAPETHEADMRALSNEVVALFAEDPVADWNLPFASVAGFQLYRSGSVDEAVGRFMRAMTEYGVSVPRW